MLKKFSINKINKNFIFIWKMIILLISIINIIEGYEKILFIKIIDLSMYNDETIMYKLGYIIGYYFKPFILGIFLFIVTIINIIKNTWFLKKD